MDADKNNSTVAIVVPHYLLARGLASIIEDLKNFTLIATIHDDCSYFVEKLSLSHPDILIIDPDILEFKKRGDIEGLMKETGTTYIVALGSHHIPAAILNRYHAVIGISDSFESIENKLEKLILTEKRETESDELSYREKEILVCIARGMMNKEIADKYNLSIHTVITHRKNITKKTGIKSVSGLTVFAILNNLIDIQSIE